jgi:hypothetical protein
VDGENYQPYFHVEIPPPRVVTPPRQIYSLNSFISQTTRSETDDEETDNDFDADNRDPNNYTFDEYAKNN